MTLRLISLYCFIIHFVPLFAQINTIKFEHYSANEGLSQATVKCIQQDTLGFMWFGTVNGLNRFDGLHFKQYFHDVSDSTSLSSSNITALYEDRRGNLWVGTTQGLNLFDRATNTFIRFEHHTGYFILCYYYFVEDG